MRQLDAGRTVEQDGNAMDRQLGETRQEKNAGPDVMGSGGDTAPHHKPRRMVRDELLGRHSHHTAQGTTVHIWRRGEMLLLRGRWHGRQFGETLGADPVSATSRFYEIMAEIGRGTYTPPSDARRRPFKTGAVPELSLRDLFSRVITITRSLRGRQTAADYASRLAPAIEFAERPENARRWPRAIDIDGDMEFALGMRAFLFERQVARNGHAAALPRRISARQVHNILSTVATILNRAKAPAANLLPSTFVNPFTHDIIGERSRRDPLAPPKFSLESRIALVNHMDAWQLCTLAWSLVLPMRPDELAGLVISDVDRDRHELIFSSRWGGDDHNKAKQCFRVPYPKQFVPLLTRLIGTRTEGPLLQRRTVFDRRHNNSASVATTIDLAAAFDQELTRAGRGQVQTEADRKSEFRRLLRKLGGTDADELAAAFRSLRVSALPQLTARYYDLRGSVITDLKRAGVEWLLRLYITGRSLKRETMADYEAQDLHGDMNKYFVHIASLLRAIDARATILGINP